MAIATSEQAVVDAVPKQLYVGGEWRDGGGGETLTPPEAGAWGTGMTWSGSAKPIPPAAGFGTGFDVSAPGNGSYPGTSVSPTRLASAP